jgi:hypothetical protein
MEYWNDGRMEGRRIQKTGDRMKEIVPITKVRNLESTKKELVFYINPSSFVLSYPAKLTAGKLRVFVMSP